jgi:putative ABC transport system ATP-binding protein
VLNEHRCIVIVTHDSRIFDYADRILHMEDGRLKSVDLGSAK